MWWKARKYLFVRRISILHWLKLNNWQFDSYRAKIVVIAQEHWHFCLSKNLASVKIFTLLNTQRALFRRPVKPWYFSITNRFDKLARSFNTFIRAHNNHQYQKAKIGYNPLFWTVLLHFKYNIVTIDFLGYNF